MICGVQCCCDNHETLDLADLKTFSEKRNYLTDYIFQNNGVLLSGQRMDDVLTKYFSTSMIYYYYD
jgi:hypothetical protein